jgi:AcrR family transcriptional regulator
MPSNSQVRRLSPAEKRDMLLDSAMTLFRTRGIAETTVEEITQATGVAKGTFYLYFQTKDDLVDALRVEFAGQLEQDFRNATPPAEMTGWPGFLATLVETAVDQIADQQDLHDLVATLGHAHAEGPLNAAMEGVHRAVAELLDEGVRVGALDVLDTSTAAWLLFDLIQAAGDRASMDPPNAGRHRRAVSNAVLRWLVKR